MHVDRWRPAPFVFLLLIHYHHSYSLSSCLHGAPTCEDSRRRLVCNANKRISLHISGHVRGARDSETLPALFERVMRASHVYVWRILGQGGVTETGLIIWGVMMGVHPRLPISVPTVSFFIRARAIITSNHGFMATQC